MDGWTGGQTDGLTDDQCETLIPRYYCVAGYKNENFQIKISDIFHISAQNIDCVLIRTVSMRQF